MPPSHRNSLLLSSLCSLCLGAPSAPTRRRRRTFSPPAGSAARRSRCALGGLNLHDRCGWELLGSGVACGRRLTPIPTRWFEGPRLPLAASQQVEDYPRDFLGEVRIAADAAPGVRRAGCGRRRGPPPAWLSRSATCPRWSRKRSTATRRPSRSSSPSPSTAESSRARTSTPGRSPPARDRWSRARCSPSAAGPRVVSSTMGVARPCPSPLPPPGGPTMINARDPVTGIPQFNGFFVSVRPLRRSDTFTAAQIQVPGPGATRRHVRRRGRGVPITLTNLSNIPQDLHPSPFGVESFLVTFSPLEGVGTYSYAIGPGSATGSARPARRAW